jgi:hypothetical protein
MVKICCNDFWFGVQWKVIITNKHAYAISKGNLNPYTQSRVLHHTYGCKSPGWWQWLLKRLHHEPCLHMPVQIGKLCT